MNNSREYFLYYRKYIIQKGRKNMKNLLKNVTLAGIFCILAVSCSGCEKNKAAGMKSINPEPATAAASTNQSRYSLDLGESFLLPLSDETITSCTSSNPEIVAVSQKGNLHARKQGKAKIEIMTKDGDTTHKRLFHIKVRKHGMVYPAFSMMKGEHLDLQFSRKKVHAVWKSDKPAVAKVSKRGKVIAKKKGTATITGTTKDKKTYTCHITVTKRIKSVIYLTFDDGPNRYTTPKILKVLKKNQVKATFFELKPAKKDFDLTKRVIEEGHTLALHGYQHKYDIIYKSQKVYHNNLDQLRNLFFQKYGVWCTASRFPGGSSNTCSRYNKGIMTKLTRKLDGWGYHYFDWNVDSCDAGGARNSQEVFRNVKKSLVKNRGNVVLMHDFYKNDKTIHALDKIIRYGKKQGYTFLPITASTTEVHHQVNN